MGFRSFLLVIMTFLLISSIAYGQASFSNDDLKRYKTKSDSDQGAGQGREESGGYNIYDSYTSGNSDYWCQQGERARSEISTASSNAAAAQERYDSVHAQFVRSDTNPRVTREEVDNAKLQMDAAIEAVDQAKKALELLESEAHRSGIPPGWLNCNFN